jgi:hypothetical protein
MAPLPAEEKLCTSKTMLSAHTCDEVSTAKIGLLLATATGAQAGYKSAGSGDEGENDGGVFRRIVTAGLRAKWNSHGNHQSEGKGEGCFL